MGIIDAKGNKIALNNIFDCTDFGVSTENSDNTKLMQDLIDTVALRGGGTIYIPNGTYLFDSVKSSYDLTPYVRTLLKAKSNVSFVGESLNAILKVIGNTQNGAGLFCQTSEESKEILTSSNYSNFTVDMTEATLTEYSPRGKAFFFSGIQDCIFRDLKILGTPSTSMGIDMLNNVVLDSLYIYKGGKQWKYGGGGGAGIGIGTGKWKEENYIIRNCICVECGHFGIFLEDQGLFETSKPKNYPRGQIITNNIIRNGKHYGIGVRGGEKILITDNSVYENKGGFYTDYGAKEVLVSNNIFSDNTESAICYGNEYAGYPCEDIAITNNMFINNGVDIKKDLEPLNSFEQNNITIPMV